MMMMMVMVVVVVVVVVVAVVVMVICPVVFSLSFHVSPCLCLYLSVCLVGWLAGRQAG